jgi:hypothetical protein
MLDVELIMFIHFCELQAVGVVLIDHLECQFGLLVADVLAHLLHHHLELLEVQTPSALLVEVVEHLLQRQAVLHYYLVQLHEHLLQPSRSLRPSLA